MNKMNKYRYVYFAKLSNINPCYLIRSMESRATLGRISFIERWNRWVPYFKCSFPLEWLMEIDDFIGSLYERKTT